MKTRIVQAPFKNGSAKTYQIPTPMSNGPLYLYLIFVDGRQMKALFHCQ